MAVPRKKRPRPQLQLAKVAEEEEVATADAGPEETPQVEAPRKTKRRRSTGATIDSTTSGVAATAGGTAVAEKSGGASSSTSIFQTNTSFAKLGLARWLTETCEKMGMSYPTDVQAMTIPPIIAGRNVAGNAQTGTGKTACYCLPTLHHLSKDPYGVFALVLTPVRELAFQVSENFRALGQGIGVKVAEVVGGREMLYQSRMITERVHVVVATPGRLADLLRGDPALTEAFEGLRIFVLDEADKLLTQTFEEPLAEILQCLPKTRQTLLFSATITKSIERLRSKLSSGGTNGEPSKELLLLDANPNEQSLSNLQQQYIFVPRTVQACYLHYLLKSHFPEESCIVFTSTIDQCQLLTTTLEFLGFSVTGLHSLQSQRRRQACLNKFRGGRSRILVATDVAGRGLDIPKVAVVINIGLPLDPDDYVHRAGRTARAGRPGLVVSLMTEHDVAKVAHIETRIGCPLELRPCEENEAIKLLSKTTKARQRADLLLSEVGFEEKAQEHRDRRQVTVKRKPRDKAPGGTSETAVAS